MLKRLVPVVASIALMYSCGKSSGDCELPTLEVEANSPVYAGDALQFEVTTNATTFSWSGPNGYTSTEQNPVIASMSAAKAGAYKVTVSNGSCEQFKTVDVVVLDGPACTPTVNTISLNGSNTFNLVTFGKNSAGRYQIDGTGPQGDVAIEFFNDVMVDGNKVYTLSTGDKNPWNARMQVDVSFGNYQAKSGNLYLKLVNNKPIVTFCTVPFGHLQTGGTINGSGRIAAP